LILILIRYIDSLIACTKINCYQSLLNELISKHFNTN